MLSPFDSPGAGYLIPLGLLSMFFCISFAVAAVAAIYRRIAASRRQAPLNLHDALDCLRDAVARGEARNDVFIIIFDCVQFGANEAQISGAMAAGKTLRQMRVAHVHAR